MAGPPNYLRYLAKCQKRHLQLAIEHIQLAEGDLHARIQLRVGECPLDEWPAFSGHAGLRETRCREFNQLLDFEQSTGLAVNFVDESHVIGCRPLSFGREGRSECLGGEKHATQEESVGDFDRFR